MFFSRDRHEVLAIPLPIPTPLINLVSIRNTQETCVVRKLLFRFRDFFVFPAQNESLSLSLQDNNFPRSDFVKHPKPIFPRIGGGKPFHTYNVQLDDKDYQWKTDHLSVVSSAELIVLRRSTPPINLISMGP